MKIIIPGIPVPQTRMRYANRGSYVTTYDPKAKEKEIIKNIFLTFSSSFSFLYPRISFIFYMPIPKGIPKKKIGIYESQTLKHDKKPDVDNLIKLYLDCMDGIIIQGDQKVSLGPCVKLYSKNPRTVIWIHEMNEIITPRELDCTFLSSEEPDTPSFSEKAFLRDWHNPNQIVFPQSVGSCILPIASVSLKYKLQIPCYQG